MRIDFSFDVNNIDAIFEKMVPQMEQVISNTLDDAAELLIKRIQETAPRDSGDYANSWTVGEKTKDYIEVITPEGLLYIMLEYQGRRPGKIEGNPLLAFEKNGVTVIVHSVNHPGFDAMPHARPALAEVIKLVPPLFYKHLRELIPFFA